MQRQCIDSFLKELGLAGPASSSAGEGRGLALSPASPRLPLLDVRSPCEYAQGHIPGAVNLPLFSDAERAEVGTLYRRESRDAAMYQGLAFVSPRLEALAREAVARAGNGREVALYCSRGGMRSASMAWLCSTMGLRGPVLAGGYKAFRRYVLGSLERPRNLRVLGGRTGSGKTEVLRLLAGRGEQALDLEGLARHRGSAFGALEGVPQPGCAQFENLLALALDQCDPASPVWLEDECENLGSLNIPPGLYRQLREAPLTLLETPRTARLCRVLEQYGDIPAERMAAGLDRIRKRLGGLAHKQAHACLAAGDQAGLAAILLDYYDRAYDRQLARRPPVAAIAAETPEEAADILLEF